VCYAWFEKQATVGLFLIYPKNEQDNLTADDEAGCRQLIRRMQEALSRS
jgi:hypothetical protein